MNSIWRGLTLLKQCDLLGNSLQRRSLLSQLNFSQIMRPFSMLRANSATETMTTTPLLHSPLSASASALPSVFGTTSVPARGLKVKARVYHRCRDCYFQYSKGILYNLCRTHGRHRQMLKPKYLVNQRILTAVCQKPKKPW